MRSLFYSFANRTAALLMKLLFGCVARVWVWRRENANHAGGFLLEANHISHFDPFIISSVVRRKIDWMTMAEFFRFPLLGLLLRAVDAFPADRHRADRKTIRTAIDYIQGNGGCRCGAHQSGSPLAIRSRISPTHKNPRRANGSNANWPPRSNFCTQSCAKRFRSHLTIFRIHQESECSRNRHVSSTTKITKGTKKSRFKRRLFRFVIFVAFVVRLNHTWCRVLPRAASTF